MTNKQWLEASMLEYTAEDAYQLGYDVAKNHNERLTFEEAIQLNRKMTCEWRGHEHAISFHEYNHDEPISIYCMVCAKQWDVSSSEDQQQ